MTATASMPTRDVSEHAPALDGLRGVAVLLVITWHWDLPWKGFPLDRGLLGVRLFFALSGFLITSILLGGRGLIARGEATVGSFARAFYARRLLRIFPLYYGTLAVLWALDVAGVREEMLWHLGYATSLLVARENHWIGITSHFWSLSVEEHFYLLWPWAVLLAPRRALPWLFAVVALGGSLWRTAGLFAGFGRFALLYTLPGSLDALGVGALLALVHREHPALAARVRAGMFVAGAALVAAVTAVAGGEGATRFTHVAAAQKALGHALMLGAAVSACARGDGALVRAMSWRPLVEAGRVSYALYVVHPMVPEALHAVGVRPRVRVVEVALHAALTFVLAAASWRWFEGPLNARKKRFPYRRT